MSKLLSCFLIIFFSFVSGSVVGWEDHADVQDHKETDRIFKSAQKQTQAVKHEKDMLIAKEKEDLKNFKSSKFKRKQNEESHNNTACDIDDCP